MKKTIIIFALFIIWNSIYSQENPDSLINELNVSKQTVLCNKVIVGNNDYDIYGNLTYYTNDGYSGGKVKRSARLIYNVDGNKISAKSTHSSYPNDTTYWKFEYDKNNLITIKNGYNDILIFSFLYDSVDRKVEEIQYDLSGDIYKLSNFKYDKEGKLITENNFNPELEYNKDKRVVKEIYKIDNEQYGTLFKYNGEGRIVRREQFNVFNKELLITRIQKFKYYKNGLIKKYSEKYVGDKIIKYKYIYKIYKKPPTQK